MTPITNVVRALGLQSRGRLSAAARRPTLWMALCLASWLVGCATAAPKGAALDQRLRMRDSGAPIVVFQSGLGDGAAVWSAVQDGLAEDATTIAFSRAGYGRSPPVQGDRSPCAVAAEQREMLQRAGLAPPYVLVGHSLGGLYQYAFARLYPEDVAGLVLLDPTHPQHWKRLQSDLPSVAAVARVARMSPAFTGAMRREFDDQERCLESLAARPMPNVPAEVLVRGRFVVPESGAFERLMREFWLDWPALIGAQAVTPVDGSGHYIQRDRPGAAVEAIRRVMQGLP